MRSVRCWTRAFSLGLAAWCPLAAAADPLPLWEAQIGLGALYAPVYRGATETQGYALPYPYALYRGESFSADEEGLHGWLWRSERFKLDLSMAGGLPVPGDSGARAGMPSLDPTGELGPTLEVTLWREAAAHRGLWLSLPVRAVVAADFWSLSHEGWLLAPFLQYVHNHDRPGRWEVALSAGPQFADAAYHDYYYSVAPAYATAGRPAYAARGGYNGSRITLSFTRDFGAWWLGGLLRYDSLRGTAFEDSPLLQSDHYFIVGLAVSWTFARSATLVNR